MTSSSSSFDRPLGFWLRAVDALLDGAFTEALAGEGVSRRDWMILNVVDGSVDAPWIADRVARRGPRVRRLVERGWIAESDEGWTLTDDGRAAKERLGSIVDGIRERVAGAVTADAYATTVRTLEAVARELGWGESAPLGQARPRRGSGRRHGFGYGFGPHTADAEHDDHRARFGRGRRFRPGHGFAPHLGPGHTFGHAHHCGAHPARPAQPDDMAFERGFSAGFAQGRAAAATA